MSYIYTVCFLVVHIFFYIINMKEHRNRLRFLWIINYSHWIELMCLYKLYCAAGML